MASGLFSEFESTNKAAWITQVEKELRKSYASVSKRALSENTFIEPYYTAEEIDQEVILEIHHAQRRSAGWLNAIELVKPDTETSEKQPLPFSLDGVDAIFMPADKALFDRLQRQAEIEKKDIAKISVYWSDVWKNVDNITFLTRSAPPLTGSIADDPLTSFVKNGENPLTSVRRIADGFNWFKDQKNFRLFMISSAYAHERGADPVQEMAYLISGLVYYLDQLTDLDISPDDVIQRMFFSVPVGTEYLTEIAKLRALRVLYHRIARSYGTTAHPDHCVIHATTSNFYRSSVAVEENMLRNTSQAMSAVIGGCNLLTVRPHSASDEQLAPRIARNISLILDHESRLQNQSDPAAGSYLLDKITYELTENAWTLFLKIEDEGGFIRAWNSGFTPAIIERAWQRKIAEAKAGRVVVGLNRYAKTGASASNPMADGSERSIETTITFAGNFPGTDRI